MPVSLEVTFAAYLAVLLGTFIPVTFLIVLYAQVIVLYINIFTDYLSTFISPLFLVLYLIEFHCTERSQKGRISRYSVIIIVVNVIKMCRSLRVVERGEKRFGALAISSSM